MRGQVMARLMQGLGVPIPAYVRTDRLLLSHKATGRVSPDSSQAQQEQQLQPEDPDSSSGWSFSFIVASTHGEQCPLPMVASAGVSFYDHAAVVSCITQPAANASAAAAADSAAAAATPQQPPAWDVSGLPELLPGEVLSGALPWRLQRSCSSSVGDVAVVLQLQLVEAADEDKRQQQVS